MKSDLNAVGFRKKLKKNTKRSSILANLSPFALFDSMNESDKVFSGKFSDTNFILTKNRVLFPSIYKIEGTYSELNENECAVAYAVKPIRLFKFLYVFALVINTMVAVFFSFAMIVVKEDEGAGIASMIMIGLVLVVPVLVQKYHKRSMEDMFREIFKIRD